MTPRDGRPIKGCSKRDKSLQLKELKLLNKCAKQLDTTRTEVVNVGIRLVKNQLDKK